MSRSEQPDEDGVERTITSSRRKRCDARSIDPAIQARVERHEVFEVRAVSRPGCVEQCHHQTRVTSPNTARRLDVLTRGLRLPHDGHQPQPIDIDADRNHVGGEHDILDVGLTKRGTHQLEMLRNLGTCDTRRHLNWRHECSVREPGLMSACCCVDSNSVDNVVANLQEAPPSTRRLLSSQARSNRRLAQNRRRQARKPTATQRRRPGSSAWHGSNPVPSAPNTCECPCYLPASTAK